MNKDVSYKDDGFISSQIKSFAKGKSYRFVNKEDADEYSLLAVDKFKNKDDDDCVSVKVLQQQTGKVYEIVDIFHEGNWIVKVYEIEGNK